MTNPVFAKYAGAADLLTVRFDEIDAATLYAPVADWLPPAPARVLDIGAGTGRDARWFAQLGHSVTAVEPVDALRTGDEEDAITWVSSSLPDLAGVSGQFDLITLSGVWHHVHPDDRARALARIAALTAPRAVCLMSLREGPGVDMQTVWSVPTSEVCADAATAGFTPAAIVATAAQQKVNRVAGVRFTWLALQRDQA